MDSKCAVRGCELECSVGSRLCAEHLAQVDPIQHAVASQAACSVPTDPYEALVLEHTGLISSSDEMRNLALAIFESGVRDAVDSFPGLAVIPGETLEQLASYLAVSTVSAVIQERAHSLARARLLAKSLPPEQAQGIEAFVQMELELAEGDDEKVTGP